MRSAPPGLPRGLMLHHGVEDRQQLAHAGRQGHLFGFARGEQALVEGCEHRIMADRHERGHIQVARRGAVRPDGAAPPHGATVAIERGDPARAAIRWRLSVPNSGRSSSSVRAETGPMPGTRRYRSRARARQDWPATSYRGRRPGPPLGVEPGEMSLDGRLNRRGRCRSGCARRCASPPVGAAGSTRRAVPPSARLVGAAAAAGPPRQSGPRLGHPGYPFWPTAPSLSQNPGPGGD